MRTAGAGGGARAGFNALPSATPQSLEIEAAAPGRLITPIGARGCLRLTKAGSVLIVGAGPTSRAEAIERLVEADRYSRRRRP